VTDVCHAERVDEDSNACEAEEFWLRWRCDDCEQRERELEELDNEFENAMSVKEWGRH
jgi:hypothetical protein